MPHDTIFALSSGAPPAAIAVVRVSGPGAGGAIDGLAGSRPKPRRATMRVLRSADGATLDEALILWFPAPASATGEDIAEFHLHGGRAVIAAVLTELDAMPALRAAEPGEFTRRALGAGRIDLAQAEGLADLLAAETEAQRRAALRSAEGGVGREVGAWLTRLTDIAAMVEAELDYGDEAEVSSYGDFRDPLGDLVGEIGRALDRPPVERLRVGVRIVLAGPRNSGKSSLINALSQRDVSIVAPIAGTTRDVVETTVVRDGRVFILADTAGLAETTDDPIEAIGIARARALLDTSDLVLWLGDDPPSASALWLYPRADAREPAPDSRIATSQFWPNSISTLWMAIAAATDEYEAGEDQQLYNARQRQRAVKASEALIRARVADDLLVVAEELRQARAALGQLLGYDEIDTMLDALFARFCVGK